jgi:hypothetical protein
MTFGETRRLLLLLFGLLVGTGYSPVASADSATVHFSAGKLEFDHKRFNETIQHLQSVLYPTVLLTEEDTIVQAREMLGLSYFYVGLPEKAQEEFKLLLYLRPRHRLNPFLIPPPAVIFFDQLWNDPAMKEKLEKIEKERQEKARLESEKNQQLSQPQPTLVRRVYLKQVETHRSRLVTFLPFGLGQFQNGHTLKGVLLASGSGVALATNILSYSFLSALALSDGKYSKGDVPLAERLKITQYVSLGFFAATWIYGIIDANIYFESVTKNPVQTEREENDVPSPATTGFFPMLSPSGGGLVFSVGL